MSLTTLCSALDISKRTYYRFRNKPDSDDKSVELIYKIFNESKGTYGHRRIAIAFKSGED